MQTNMIVSSAILNWQDFKQVRPTQVATQVTTQVTTTVTLPLKQTQATQQVTTSNNYEDSTTNKNA